MTTTARLGEDQALGSNGLGFGHLHICTGNIVYTVSTAGI